MPTLNRNGLATRAFAVFIAAYCVLASGRALVPGLCATLVDLDRDHEAAAPSCHAPTTTCCHDGSDGCDAITTPPHPCAFCALVHAPALIEAAPVVARPAFSTPLTLAAHDCYVPDFTGAEAYTLRGPPIS